MRTAHWVFLTLTGIFLIASVARATDSIPGNALTFDGIDDQVEVPHSYTFNSGSFTVEAWVRSTGGTGGDPSSIVSTLWEDFMEATTWGFQLNVGSFSGDEVEFEVYAGWSGGSVTGPAIRGDGQWHHIAAVYDGDLTLFVDGARYDGGYGDYDYPEANLLIGASSLPWYTNFEGDIDEVRLWDHARTAQEIREHAHLTLVGTETGLLSYWQCNEAPGSTIAVDAVSGFDGTVSGAVYVSSPIPVGGGSSVTQIVNSAGSYDFGLASASIDYMSFSGTDSVTVTRLDLAPNILPGLDQDLDSQYWIYQSFGDGLGMGELKLNPSEDLPTGDDYNPGNIQLSMRETNSTTAWSGSLPSIGCSTVNNEAHTIPPAASTQLFLSRQEQNMLITGLVPLPDSYDLPPHPVELEISWNQPPQVGAGQLLIKRLADHTTIASFGAADFTVSGNSVLVDASSVVDFGDSYYVQFGPDVFHDGSLNYNLGFSSVETWRFSMADFQIVSLEPADNAIDVQLNKEPQIHFSLPITAGPGHLRIMDSDDFSLVQSFAAVDLLMSNSFVTIIPETLFDYGASYYIEFDGDAFFTGDSSYYAALTGSDAWNYSVVSSMFSLLNVDLEGVANSSVQWGDYDNDGDLDILLTGQNSDLYPTSRIYQNNSGDFVDISAGLPGVHKGSAQWGDYDNDGDLDILLTGENSLGDPLSRIYENTNGSFTDIGAGLPGVHSGSVQWGDMDNDGDLDILLTGAIGVIPGTMPISRIYANNNGSFTDISAGLPGLYNSSVQWGDMNNDGNLDILFMGVEPINAWEANLIARVYRNNGDSFTDASAGLLPLYNGSTQWADMDNDGDLDILATGTHSSYPVDYTVIYLNDGGSFGLILPEMLGVHDSSVQWGDMDNDGDLDILVTGATDTGRISHIYQNNSLQSNTAPEAPENLVLTTTPDSMSLSWDPGFDVETPVAGLSYNLRLGNPENHDFYQSGMADRDQGYRLLPAQGNAQQNLNWTLQLSLPQTNAYPQESRRIVAAVQAVDHAFAGGAWAETFIDLNPDIEYLELTNISVVTPDDVLNWELLYADQIDGFELQTSINETFDSPLSEDWIPLTQVGGEREVFAGIALSELDSLHLIQEGITHYWRIRPVYTDPQRVTVFSETPGEFILVEPPAAPQAFSINIVDDHASLSWDAVPGALVYYIVYSTSDPSAAFPDGWQVDGAPTVETAWLDPVPAGAVEKKFYRVKAVVVE